MHRTGAPPRLAFAAGERADRRIRRDVLADADLPQKVARDLVHDSLIHPVEEPRRLDRLAAEEQVARDRQLRHQRRILVDRLDAEGDGIGRVLDAYLAAAHLDVAAAAPA